MDIWVPSFQLHLGWIVRCDHPSIATNPLLIIRSTSRIAHQGWQIALCIVGDTFWLFFYCRFSSKNNEKAQRLES